jgi:hypothetical protein
MTMTQSDLQSAIAAQRRSGGHRYPSDIRKAVVAFVRVERARGRSLGSLAESLALPMNTLRRWSEKHRGHGRLKPVEVVTAVACDRPVLVTRSGHRVEGLSMTSLLEMLERLG